MLACLPLVIVRVELRLAWLAEDFWGVGTGAGAVAYPVDMAEAIGWRLPLDVRPVPHLHTVHLHGYARRLGIEPLDAGPERRLRGCLLARRGRGIVFVDSADTACVYRAWARGTGGAGR
jgi:hypothetical protein